MKSIISILSLAVIIFACNQKQEKQEATQPRNEHEILCYSYMNKDTVKLQIMIHNDNSVMGDLEYSIFEKDRNTGQFVGKIYGDTIVVEYEFMSEGSGSVREVAFLKNGETLIEGFGPMDETGTRFANRSQITFTGFELKKTKCDD